MKSKMKRLGLLLAVAGLALCARNVTARAQDDDRGRLADRLERLERRLNELAQRQEQAMRQPGPGMAHPSPGPQPNPGPGGHVNPGPGQPQMNPPGPDNHPKPMPGPGPRGPHDERGGSDLRGLLRVLFLVGLICNVLLSVWIYTDIRKRGEGSGIFVALALVAGIPAAVIYSLVRIGDKKSAPTA